MIEGLKVTIIGSELREIAVNHAAYHDERCHAYAEQIASMEANRIEGMSYTNGDPIRALKDRAAGHAADADEMRFIAAHIDVSESYLLERKDLHRLGIVAKEY